MFKIKNGRLISPEIVFELPEGFNLTINDPYCFEDALRFISDKKVVMYGRMIIELMFCKANISAKEVGKYGVYGSQIRSEVFPVTRGIGTAYGAYYNGIPGFMDIYTEKYDCKEPINGANQFVMNIFLRASKGKKLTQRIEDMMQLPLITKFLDSVGYM